MRNIDRKIKDAADPFIKSLEEIPQPKEFFDALTLLEIDPNDQKIKFLIKEYAERLNISIESSKNGSSLKDNLERLIKISKLTKNPRIRKLADKKIDEFIARAPIPLGEIFSMLNLSCNQYKKGRAKILIGRNVHKELRKILHPNLDLKKETLDIISTRIGDSALKLTSYTSDVPAKMISLSSTSSPAKQLAEKSIIDVPLKNKPDSTSENAGIPFSQEEIKIYIKEIATRDGGTTVDFIKKAPAPPNFSKYNILRFFDGFNVSLSFAEKEWLISWLEPRLKELSVLQKNFIAMFKDYSLEEVLVEIPYSHTLDLDKLIPFLKGKKKIISLSEEKYLRRLIEMTPIDPDFLERGFALLAKQNGKTSTAIIQELKQLGIGTTRAMKIVDGKVEMLTPKEADLLTPQLEQIKKLLT